MTSNLETTEKLTRQKALGAGFVIGAGIGAAIGHIAIGIGVGLAMGLTIFKTQKKKVEKE